MQGKITFNELEVGSEIKPIIKTVTVPQLFMFSAVIWNPQRFHYDPEYARNEAKLPGALVHAPLEACFLVQMLEEWVGGSGNIRKLGWNNRGMAIAGETLTCGGKVSNKYIKDNEKFVECELWIKNDKGENLAPGNALLSL